MASTESEVDRTVFRPQDKDSSLIKDREDFRHGASHVEMRGWLPSSWSAGSIHGPTGGNTRLKEASMHLLQHMLFPSLFPVLQTDFRRHGK